MGLAFGRNWATTTLLIVWAFPAVAAHAGPAFPVVPGYHILKDSGKVDAAAQGELLLEELNCVACHTASTSRFTAKGGPDLRELGLRITPQYLRRFLADPHATKPGTTMPDVLHDMPEDKKREAIDALVHFLIAGYGDYSLTASTPEMVKQGQELYTKIGCLACHAPEKGQPAKALTVPLGDLAEKTTVTALTAFLLDPTHTRPAGRMPAMGLTPVEARAISVYLLRQQLEGKTAATQPIPGSGLHVEYYEQIFTSALPEKFAGLKPQAQADVKTFTLEFAGRKSKDHFGLKFTGWIWIPQSGKYTFNLKSDDGSILYIDQRLVVSYDGIHPARDKRGEIELQAGTHPIQLTYFQNGGTLSLDVRWSGPDFAEQPVPAEVLATTIGKAMVPLHSEGVTPIFVDAEKARAGGKLFASLGCASCHAMKGVPSTLNSPALATMKVDAPGSCVAERVAAGRPRFDLSVDQRSAIATAMKNIAAFSTPRDSATQVIHTMAAMNCIACHQRGDIGGVTTDRNDLFKLTSNVDVGDEGRLPPRLTGVGAKLQPAAIERIVYERQLHVRPYMATRMPNFSRSALPGLADLLGKADSGEWANSTAARIIPGDEKPGRTLVGVRGYGCVNCHGVHGAKSLGAPSVDLAFAAERLQPQWFRAYLADPNKLNPGTRMPAFWPEGEASIKELGGGTFDGQANAIWSYLQQAKDLPVPDGLRLDGNDELLPSDEPIVLRAFVTGVSPRSILVGTPEGLHCVFDANTVRLAKTWHGRFFDAKGVWQARGGRSEPPIGKDVIDLPAGPSFAVLDSMAAPWPQATGEFDRNLGGRFLGYTLDEKQRPTFRYQLADTTIEEKPLPKGAGDHVLLQRQFKLTTTKPTKDLYFLIATGKTIEAKGAGVWLVDGKVTINLVGENLSAAQTRDGKEGVKELVMPVDFNGKPTVFTVEISW